MTRIRCYRPGDAAKVDEIYKRCHGHFNLPNIKHCISMAVIEKDDEVIALGALQLIPEAILVLDKDRPKKEQVFALKELIETAVVMTKLKGFDEFYAFPDSNTYAGILKKHFGFQDGENILIKRIDDGE